MDNARPDKDVDVIAELRRANHLLSIIAVRGMPQADAIALLDSVDVKPAQIALALGMTANAVRVALHRIRRRQDVNGEASQER